VSQTPAPHAGGGAESDAGAAGDGRGRGLLEMGTRERRMTTGYEGRVILVTGATVFGPSAAEGSAGGGARSASPDPLAPRRRHRRDQGAHGGSRTRWRGRPPRRGGQQRRRLQLHDTRGVDRRDHLMSVRCQRVRHHFRHASGVARVAREPRQRRQHELAPPVTSPPQALRTTPPARRQWSR
jgi:hypothetical protein